MKDRLQTVIDRFQHLTAELSDPIVIGNANKFRELSRERASLEVLVGLSQEYLKLLKTRDESESLVSSGGEMADLAREEIAEINRALPGLEKKILIELLPKDPNEGKNIILEIRAGAGGEEASLFVGDLYRMYLKFAAKRGWRVEMLSDSPADRGGYKEVVASIEGADVYTALKYESGVHRVQRVPATEASGRIHTSTVTVAIMAEAEEADLKIDDKDLRIDVFRAGGKGGQGVNTTDSAVRVVHLPTNTVVVCQDERSQIKNKAKAMKILRTRLVDVQREKEASERAAQRKSQVGTGERNERIRTYNFPQERVTDHRINLTLKRLTAVMEGDLEEILESLQQDEYTRLLAEGSA